MELLLMQENLLSLKVVINYLLDIDKTKIIIIIIIILLITIIISSKTNKTITNKHRDPILLNLLSKILKRKKEKVKNSSH